MLRYIGNVEHMKHAIKYGRCIFLNAGSSGVEEENVEENIIKYTKLLGIESSDEINNITSKVLKTISEVQPENDKENKIVEQKELKEFLLQLNFDIDSYGLTEGIDKKDPVTNDFNADRSKYTPLLFKKLFEKEVLKTCDLGQELDAIDRDALMMLSKNAIELEINEEGEVIFKYEGKNKELKEYNLSIMSVDGNGEVISEILPEITFDVTGGGVKSIADELEAIYKVSVMNKFLNNAYSKRIVLAFVNLNFKTMKYASAEGETFLGILRDMQTNSTAAMRMIFTACNVKLSDIKSKKEVKLFQQLSIEESQEFVGLSLDIKQEILKLEEKRKAFEHPWELIKEEAELKTKIENKIKSSSIGVIYKIFKMNAETIPEVYRSIIANCARDLSREIQAVEDFKDNENLRKIVERRLRRRATREWIIDKKFELLEKYRNGEEVVFIEKR